VIVVGSGLCELTDILQTPEAFGLQHILISSGYPHVGFLVTFFLLVEPIFILFLFQKSGTLTRDFQQST